MKPIALIHITSGETIQNLLPILAIRPQQIVNLTTSKFAGRGQRLLDATRTAGESGGWSDLQIGEKPGISDSKRLVTDAINSARRDGFLPVVNFSGGTKLMSIGAWQAARDENVASVYTDTDAEQFLDGGTGQEIQSVLNGDATFRTVQSRLNVKTLLAAHGVSIRSEGISPERYQRFAEYLHEDTMNPARPGEEEAVREAMHGRNGLCPNGAEPKNARDWLALLDRPVSIPDRPASRALEAGLLRNYNGRLFLPDLSRRDLKELAEMGKLPAGDAFAQSKERYFSAVRPIQFAMGILSGGWVEVVAHKAANASGRFNGLLWSVETSGNGASEWVEDDIIGVDGVRLAYFSCKRGGAKGRLARSLEELDGSAKRLGGMFTRKFFCLGLPPAKSQLTTLTSRARELDVRVVVGWHLHKPNSYR